MLYTGDAADRALIQQHELRFAGDPKASKRAKFNVLLVLFLLHAVLVCGLGNSLLLPHLSALSSFPCQRPWDAQRSRRSVTQQAKCW